MTLAYRMVLVGSSGIMASLCAGVVVYSIAMVSHVLFVCLCVCVALNVFQPNNRQCSKHFFYVFFCISLPRIIISHNKTHSRIASLCGAFCCCCCCDFLKHVLEIVVRRCAFCHSKNYPENNWFLELIHHHRLVHVEKHPLSHSTVQEKELPIYS